VTSRLVIILFQDAMTSGAEVNLFNAAMRAAAPPFQDAPEEPR